MRKTQEKIVSEQETETVADMLAGKQKEQAKPVDLGPEYTVYEDTWATWQPTYEGESIRGLVADWDPADGRNERAKGRLNIQGDDGVGYRVYNNSSLKASMEKAVRAEGLDSIGGLVGRHVVIVYKGKTPTKKGDMKVFAFAVKKEG